ncbi:peptidoglycan-binding domain-containing protein [Roseibium sp. HPY-6]|uniref:peptidoglycan-binding domain-containing protein n=1 Tax=Roseibium sp. HPY-6 TaxID=3229852 RepID=UPI00338F3192
MPIYSSIGITASVGRNGQNRPADVATVQERLNELMHPPRVLLVPDGISGPKTRDMIKDFQKSVLGFRWPDARVDPAAKTIVALNDPNSEDIWAQMSIPDFPPEPAPENDDDDKGKGKDDKITKEDVIDATIDQIKSTQSISSQEETYYRDLLEEIWKANKGAYTDGGAGLTVEQREKLISIGLNGFKIIKASLTFAAAGTAAATVFGYMSLLAPFLMVYGFYRALGHAMESGARIYGFVGMSYYMTHWVFGGLKPVSCPTIVKRQEEAKGQDRTNPEKMEKFWRKGQADAKRGLEEYCKSVASKTGTTEAEAQAVFKAALRVGKPYMLARAVLKDLSKKARADGDHNVANMLEIHSDDLFYPN